MSDLLLDYDTWDVDIVNGDLVFMESKETLARQAVVITLRTFRGEWFKNIDYGTPWIKNNNNSIAMLGKTPQLMFDSYLRGAILYNDEIISILEYSSSKDSDSGLVTVECLCEIEGGTIEFTEEI